MPESGESRNQSVPASSPQAESSRSACPETDLASGIACLLAATRDLNSAAGLSEGLRLLADRLRQYVDYDTFAVLLLDDRGRELHFELAEGFQPEVEKHWRFGLGQGIVGTVAQTRRPLRIADVSQDARYLPASTTVRSELALPLITKRRTIGVMDLGSAQIDYFTREHERLLTSLADHLASAIENARLYQNMREQAQTLSLLHEMSRELASILDRKRLMVRVAELLRPLIDFDLFSVLLWNEETAQLEPSVTLFKEGLEKTDAKPVVMGEGICGTAAALRQTIRVANVELDPRYVDCVEEYDIRSELAVPLLFKDRLIGVLDLESLHYDAFRAQHEQLLSTVASSLAIALENARLYEELREDEARLEGDLIAAKEIQKQLLPKRTPWLPGVQIAVGYEPANHLAGDFYEFLPYGEDRIGLVVADVAGKSTSAALYGSLAVGILREHAQQTQPDPATMLCALNEKLLRLAIDNRFLAMTFAVYDNSTRMLTLASSGLPHPYLLRGRTLDTLKVEGTPLGLLANRSYEPLTLRMEPGDALVICSDGVEESLDLRDQEFGRLRVEDTLRRLAHLSAEEIAQGLIEAASRFAGDSETSDDRTILVLKLVNG